MEMIDDTTGVITSSRTSETLGDTPTDPPQTTAVTYLLNDFHL